MDKKFKILIFLRNLAILAFVMLFTLYIVNRTGKYPWGSDTYGHLFKGNILYESIKNGQFFINYDQSWYNGVQPYRYWAPLPYYVLAVMNFFTNDIITTFNAFIGFVFLFGGIGWLCWGYYTERQNLALFFALLWFFVPNNLRILFSEGNIPYVMVNSLIPFVFLFYCKSIKGEGIISLLSLAAFMNILTLTHAMFAAMTGIALFILAAADSAVNKRFYKNFIMLIYAFMGIMLSSFWLYPALKGGIMGMDKGAVASVMKDLTYTMSLSLNPMIRFSNIETYYYGLAFAATAAFGFLFSMRNERAYFVSALIILFGTTKLALPVLEKLPMNQLFWMSRFTSISMAMIIMGLILWKRLKKVVLILLISIIALDSAASFYVLGFNGQFPKELANTLENAATIASERIAVLDGSQFGSFPSYYISNNKSGGSKKQVYGWAWQGAGTSSNIMMLNTALERGYYPLMFDRALELGADTLVIKKSLIGDNRELVEAASHAGYIRYEEDRSTITYKYPVFHSFGTRVNYDGIAIGAYSPNIVFLFPRLTVGKSNYIDSYTYDELKDKKCIYLSGFKYKNKKAAEDLIMKLSENNIKILIDVTGMAESFLGVKAEDIILEESYGDIYYNGKRLALKNFPMGYSSWKTSFLSGIADSESYQITKNRLINYIGKRNNENLTFIGMNIPYFAFLTKDEGAVEILEDSLNLKSYEIPLREIIGVQIHRDNKRLSIKADASNVIVPIAALDAFKVKIGSYATVNNLIALKSDSIQIEIIYPYLKTGAALSILSLIIIILLSAFIHKRRAIAEGSRDYE